MRHCVIIAAIAAIAFSGTAQSLRAGTRHHHHQARIASSPEIQDRYCVQGRTYGYPGNCAFSTLQQCLATASGQDAGCGLNPMSAYARQQPGYY